MAASPDGTLERSKRTNARPSFTCRCFATIWQVCVKTNLKCSRST